MLSRRRLLTTGALLAGGLVTGAASLPGLAGAAPTAPPDFTTREGWLTWFAAHRHLVAVHADNGAGGCLSHRAHLPQPLASAVKPVHLAAYALSGADPGAKVRVGDWESFYLPHTDGYAHVEAQKSLGIAYDPKTLLAVNPDQQVTLDQLAGTMIYFSDNAATDYLRDRFGEPALRRAARRGGWAGVDARSKLGDFLFLIVPEAVQPGVPRQEMGRRLERRFRTDPAFRDEARARVPSAPPSWAAQIPWVAGSGGASADTLATFHHALAAGRFPEPARRHLEHKLSGHLPPEVAGIGFKGGSLAGVITMGLSVRWRNGRIGSAALLLAGMSQSDWMAAATSENSLFFPVCLDLLLDPAWRARVAAALGG